MITGERYIQTSVREDAYELHTLQVFTVTAQGISRNAVFQDPEIFATFGLPAGLDAQGLGGVD